MIVNFSRYFPRFVVESAPTLLLLTGFSLYVDKVHTSTRFVTPIMTLSGVGLVTTAVAIFVGFRMTEAYERWWEARKLWGALINCSRSFGREVMTLLDCPSEVQRELLLRHIAYVRALRLALLFGPGGAEHEHWKDLDPLLGPEERRDLRGYANVTTFLAQRQAERLREVCPDTVEGRLTLLRLDDTLSELLNIQGGCERIRNTVFPAKVTALTRLLVWGLAFVMPWAVLEVNHDHHWMEIAAVVFFSFSFIKLEKVGGELKNPFDGRANSMPMRAMGRVVELDLRQMLHDDSLPEAKPPQGGVLD